MPCGALAWRVALRCKPLARPYHPLNETTAGACPPGSRTLVTDHGQQARDRPGVSAWIRHGGRAWSPPAAEEPGLPRPAARHGTPNSPGSRRPTRLAQYLLPQASREGTASPPRRHSGRGVRGPRAQVILQKWSGATQRYLPVHGDRPLIGAASHCSPYGPPGYGPPSATGCGDELPADQRQRRLPCGIAGLGGATRLSRRKRGSTRGASRRGNTSPRA